MADESPFDAFESGGLGSAPPSSLSDDPFASNDPITNDVEEEEEEEEDEEVEINGKSSPHNNNNNTIIPSSSNNNNTDSDDPFAAVDSSSSSSVSSFPSLGGVGSNESKFSEDDSAYAAWEKERTKILSDRQEKAEEKKKELLYQAKDEITKFYSDLDHRIEKTKKQNRIDEKNYKTELGALMAHGTRWEKVAKFSNLTARQTDKAGSVSRVDRMRKLLITLKTQRDQNEQKS